MNKVLLVIVGTVVATNCWAQDNQTVSASSWLKSMGKAVVDAGVQALNPQAQAVVDQAGKLSTAQEKENFLVAKAKEFLGSKNYETALQVANYVKTNINAKSASADKIIADAKAAMARYAQEKMNKASSQAATATNSTVSSLLGSFTTKK